MTAHSGSFRLGVALILAAVVVLVSSCGSTRAAVDLPVPKAGEITFYLSLPSSARSLANAAALVGQPGSAQYRHFSSLERASQRFGASDSEISTVDRRP
jgi:hypothetical protein